MVWSVTRAIRTSTQASWHCRRTGSPTVSRTPTSLQAVSPSRFMQTFASFLVSRVPKTQNQLKKKITQRSWGNPVLHAECEALVSACQAYYKTGEVSEHYPQGSGTRPCCS